MRKIKITALLLAVLMIVTAFAGCASKSTVTNLDNKVNDIEGELTDIKGTLSKIEEALGKIEAPEINVDEIVDKVKEELGKGDESGDNIPDDTGATADLATEIGKAGATIEALQGDYAANKANYTAEDYAKILEIFGGAQATISHCKKVADVKAALDAMNAKLGEIVAVNDAIYTYIVALDGHIDADAAELVEKAADALKEAVKFYKINDATAPQELKNNLLDYAIGEDEKIDLKQVLTDLIYDYEVELPKITNEAREIVIAIDAIKPSDSFNAITTGIYTRYHVWAKGAAALSEKNLALVTNYDKLLAAHTSALNSSTAATMYDAETVKSTLAATYGSQLGIFADYKALLALNEQAVFTYETVVNRRPARALTSKIYEAIDAAVAAWVDKYELTAEAAEFIIDSKEGANFYAKYNSNKALAKSFEAAYEDFAEIADDIKALNGRRLAADAINVVNAYNANATAIGKWAKALKDAYKAELKADTDLTDRTVDTEAKYADVLTANFNAMIWEADLGVYDETNKTFSCETEFNVILGDIKADADPALAADTKAYYYNLYDFDSSELAVFLTSTYKQAVAAADAINAAIKAIDVAKTDSIAALVADIAGYVTAVVTNPTAAANDQIVELVDLKTNDILKALYGVDANGAPNAVNQASNTLAPGAQIDTIAKFNYYYNTNVKYDLSSLIDTKLYDEKLTAVEAKIAAAAAALKAVNDKYAELLGDKAAVAVNMDNYAGITQLRSLLTSWINKGNLGVKVKTVVAQAGGIEKTLLVPVNTNLPYATDAYLYAPANGTGSGIIVKLYDSATLLKNTGDLVAEAYNAIAKLDAGIASFSYVDMGGKIDAIKYLNTAGSNLKHAGVVGVTIGEAATGAGTDANGAYQKGDRLWTIEYVTVQLQNGRAAAYDVTVSTATKSIWTSGANKNNDVNTVPVEVKNWVVANLWTPGAAATDWATLKAQIFTEIPALVNQNGLYATMAALVASAGNKIVANYQLPALAMALEAKFIIDNGKTLDKIATAKEAAGFTFAAGSNGFNYIKGMTCAYLNADLGISGMPDNTVYDSLNASDVCDLASLKLAVYNFVANGYALDPVDITFGAADASWASTEYGITVAANHTAAGVVIYK